MSGGAGNDSYVVDVVGDSVSDTSGTDTVSSSTLSLSAASFAGIENLTLTGSASLNLTGNSGANTLTGNSGINIIDGGTGTDTMVGGTGNDTYIVDVATDIVTEAAGGGTADKVQSATISLNLASYANVERATLTGALSLNLTGNAGNNVLTGNTGNNLIDGGGGIDTMAGKHRKRHLYCRYRCRCGD